MKFDKPYFIAEVSSNHNGQLDRCIEFIKVASEVGCDAVKFQLFKIDDLFVSSIIEKSEDHKRRREWELNKDFLPILANETKSLGMQFSCTPFYLSAVDELSPYVDFFKIASYELLWDKLIYKCAKTNIPLVLSTGMANLIEVSQAVKVARDSGCQNLSLLHCVSGYPTNIEDCNLFAIKTLRDEFKCNVGWSDHTVNPVVISEAINRCNASIIEFHMDLDERGKEYHSGHCWLPKDIKKVIDAIREKDMLLGDGIKQPTDSEMTERNWRADPSDGLRPLISIRDKI